MTTDEMKEAWESGYPSDIYAEKDPSEALRIWEHKVHLALEIVAPMQQVTTKAKHNPWFTTELKELCDERDRRKKEEKAAARKITRGGRTR